MAIRTSAAILLLCIFALGSAPGPLAASPASSAEPDGAAPIQTPVPGAPAPQPGSELRVWLLTVGPGDQVWERFGHNAIRVLDTRSGRDVAYNWGLFDLFQEGFVFRFLRGEMLYSMAPIPTEAMLREYRLSNREVIQQELNLTPGERLALRDQAEWNALPEHRSYYYDYFLDNCSTRVRDLLDRVTRGALSERWGSVDTGTSYRDHIRRLTAVDPLLFTGMDILLGTPGDKRITVWEEMFVPMTLRDAVRRTELRTGDGGSRPLLREEEVLVAASRPAEPSAPPSWLFWYLLLGTLTGGLLALLGRLGSGANRPLLARIALATLGTVWTFAVGVVGVLLVAVYFTDHHFMVRNENLLVLNPISLVTAILLPVAVLRIRISNALLVTAAVAAALASLALLLSLLPGAGQDNAIFLALILPAHWGLLLALLLLRTRERKEKRDAVDFSEASRFESREVSPGPP